MGDRKWGQAVINMRLTNMETELQHIDHKLDRMVKMLQQILGQGETEMALIDDVLTQAEAESKKDDDAESAALSYLVTLAQMVANLQQTGTDPATITRIQALSAAMSARAGAAASAIVDNTVAAKPPVGNANPATPAVPPQIPTPPQPVPVAPVPPVIPDPVVPPTTIS